MNGLTFPQFLIGGVGALLIYSAIKNEMPVDVIKRALGEAQPTKDSVKAAQPPMSAPVPPAAKFKSKTK